MGVVVLHLLGFEHKAVLFQIVEHIWVSINDKGPLPGGVRELSFLIYRLDHGQVVTTTSLVVIFPKGWSRVDNPSPIFNGYIVGYCNEKGLFVGFDKGKQLVVFPIFHVLALEFF